MNLFSKLLRKKVSIKNQNITEGNLSRLCDELLVLLTDYLKEEPKTLGRIREIGEQLNQEGGFELMQKVGYMVQAKDPLKASWLNNAWGGIGDWRS